MRSESFSCAVETLVLEEAVAAAKGYGPSKPVSSGGNSGAICGTGVGCFEVVDIPKASPKLGLLLSREFLLLLRVEGFPRM